MYIYWCNEVVNIKRCQWTMFIDSRYFILVVRMISFLFWCDVFLLLISFYSWVWLTLLHWSFPFYVCRIGMMVRNRLYLVLSYKVFLSLSIVIDSFARYSILFWHLAILRVYRASIPVPSGFLNPHWKCLMCF